MNTRQNRRAQFRRYSDRRLAALLELHEILFYDEPGPIRDLHFLNTINEDYQTDRVVIVQKCSPNDDCVKILGASNGLSAVPEFSILNGSGISKILRTHTEFEGALTLSKFRSSSFFEAKEWQELWTNDLGRPASALLSVAITPQNALPAFLWLVVDSGSREWSSHDRDLSEEEALFLARVLEKRLFGATTFSLLNE